MIISRGVKKKKKKYTLAKKKNLTLNYIFILYIRFNGIK